MAYQLKTADQLLFWNCDLLNQLNQVQTAGADAGLKCELNY